MELNIVISFFSRFAEALYRCCYCCFCRLWYHIFGVLYSMVWWIEISMCIIRFTACAYLSPNWVSSSHSSNWFSWIKPIVWYAHCRDATHTLLARLFTFTLSRNDIWFKVISDKMVIILFAFLSFLHFFRIQDKNSHFQVRFTTVIYLNGVFFFNSGN